MSLPEIHTEFENGCFLLERSKKHILTLESTPKPLAKEPEFKTILFFPNKDGLKVIV